MGVGGRPPKIGRKIEKLWGWEVSRGRGTTGLGGLKACLGPLPGRFWGCWVGLVKSTGGSKLAPTSMEGHFDRFRAPLKIALKMRKWGFWRGWGCRMAGFPIFLETMDRGLSFGTGFKFLAPREGFQRFFLKIELGRPKKIIFEHFWDGPETRKSIEKSKNRGGGR